MEWKNILKIDGYKVLIILILLLIPRVAPSYLGDSLVGDSIYLGLPFSYIQLEYVLQGSSLVIRPTGSWLNFILNIIIAYLIGVLITFIYYKRKEK